MLERRFFFGAYHSLDLAEISRRCRRTSGDVQCGFTLNIHRIHYGRQHKLSQSDQKIDLIFHLAVRSRLPDLPTWG